MSSLKKVLFLLGCNEGPSKRYRVFNHIEYLALCGVEAEWIWDIDDRIHDEKYLAGFSIFVNFRSGFSDRVESLYRNLRRLGIPIVYDLDDLVFDEAEMSSIDAYQRMTEDAKIEYIGGVRSIASVLMQSDYLTTSTDYLRSRLIDFAHKKCWVIPFGVNAEQVEICDGLTVWSGRARFIGYLSGTKSHQTDFAEVAPALRRILTEHDDVFLKVVGFLDVSEYLSGLEHKVIRVSFMDWRDLLIETSTLYVALAPFDVSSAFCQAKSELKFVEQALCRVPTIASKIPAFEAAIRNGENGYIAEVREDWHAHLQHLIENPLLRDKMAAEAHLTCLKHYTPAEIGQRLSDCYQAVLNLHGADCAADDLIPPTSSPDTERLRISWVIPQPFEGSGGHRNIFRAIKYLSSFGHQCSLYVMRDNHRFSDGQDVLSFIAQHFFDLGIREAWMDFERVQFCDVLISTYWTASYIVRENRERAKLAVNFIQDFEPMFFPMGTDYVRSLQSYKFGFYHITSGPWPLRMIEKHTGIVGGDFFRFPIDREIYFHTQAIGYKSNRVIFFARPEMPRRCYSLGILALKILSDARPDVEIVLYGSPPDKFGHVPFAYTSLGLTKTLQELGDLYRSAAVGLCFSTTNPSLVPYEMMACGCPVVDLNANQNEINYGSADNCTLVDPDPQAIAAAVLDLLEDPKKALGQALRGLGFAQEFPSEVEMARTIERFIVDRISAVAAI